MQPIWPQLSRRLFENVYCVQFRVLMRKNYLLAIRNRKGTLGQLFTPVGIIFLLLFFQYISEIVLDQDILHPQSYKVAIIPKCRSRDGIPCHTILYSPLDLQYEWGSSRDVLRLVAEYNDLDFQTDFFGLDYKKGTTCQFLPSRFNISDILGCDIAVVEYILQNPNTTQTAIVFFPEFNVTDSFPGGFDVPKPASYEIFYNNTVKLSPEQVIGREGSPYAVEMKKWVDTAIMTLQLRKLGKLGPEEHVNIDILSKPYPVPPNRNKQYDVVADQGGIWFYIPPMITFFVMLTEVVSEKESKIRVGMKMMGMKNVIFWATWFATSTCFVFLSTLVLIFTGFIFQIEYFTNANFFVLFFTFSLFGMSTSAMGFFVSTLIATSKAAQTFGYAFILVGFVFQGILSSGYGFLSSLLYDSGVASWVSGIRWILSVYPPFNFSKAYYDISVRASSTIDRAGGRIVEGDGFSWSNLYDRRLVEFYGRDSFTIPPLSETLWLLVANMLIFWLLTWYFDNVFGGHHGSPKSPLFFLDLSYWGFVEKRKSYRRLSSTVEKAPINDDPDIAEETARAAGETGDSDLAIRIHGLRKVYQKNYWKPSADDVVAVDNVSLTMKEGEIFCLLGHNGAGKTTTINMLTGLTLPSDGSAVIYGKDIVDDIDTIRSQTGVCPQHDILWAELTAFEHLEIFCELKGLPYYKVTEHVREILETVGLYDVGRKCVGMYSGGMKRRLSVAIASIGDPRVIFLDEPTTGMDPVNRREVWHLIEKMKYDKVVILTTHSMEEADLLGDRIAIMAYGQVRCIGNSLHLKSRYGSGYRIQIISRESQSSAVEANVKAILPEALLYSNDAGSMVFQLPFKDISRLPPLLEYLESRESKELIKEWGLSHSTLEEVFVEISKKSNFKYDNIDEEDELHLEDSDDLDVDRRAKGKKSAPSSNGFRALLLKNIALQKRQKGTNVCQILTPVLVMMILLLLQGVIQSELVQEDDTEAIAPPILVNYNLLRDRVETDSTNQCLEFFLFGANGNSTVAGLAGTLFANQTGSGFLATLPQTRCSYMRDNKNVTDWIPYFDFVQGSPFDLDRGLYDIMSDYNELDIDVVDAPPVSYMLADGTVTFFDIDYDKIRLSYEFAVNDQEIVAYHRPNNFTRIVGVELDDFQDLFDADLLLIIEGRTGLMDMMHNAFMWQLDDRWASLVEYLKMFNLTEAVRYARPVYTFVRGMPFEEESDWYLIIELFGTILYPLALTIQLPIYVYLIVMEKQEKLREMMKSSGMKMRTYWLSNYVFFMVLYSAVIIFFYLSGLAIELRFFTQTDPAVIILFFFLWGNALIAFSFLLSTFLNSKRAATVVGYIIALIGSMSALFISVSLYPLTEREVMPVSFFVYLQFGFARGIYILNDACAREYVCYQWNDLEPDDEMTTVLWSLYLNALSYFILAFYLDEVLPSEYGVPKHPLFFLDPVRRWFGVKKRGEKQSRLTPEQKHLRALLRSSIDEDEDRAEDTDVMAERIRVEEGNYPPNPPVLIEGLHKVFPSADRSLPKIAVRRLNLAIDQHECFGLLGPNGAGKTTTINMLTGVFPATDGRAYVGGFDIRTEMDKVHLVTGVCPQFNVLWSTLSVQEHIRFYARLRGVPEHRLHEATIRALKEVGLQNCPHRLAKDLSGGMQRRLQVAICLVGDPSVVFLDEPTTGLDPTSRRHLWTIISRARKHRSIVLTTHSMHEAEVLCTRIGIFVDGALRCLGEQVFLCLFGFCFCLLFDCLCFCELFFPLFP
eukprot:TRINITY_DN1758_c0_g1_i16.p1 TRINITY_DN1758_c0_g1~~TRINITY_DN1758_c0_g1_i16.p1  ORF type:complete len:1757 (-),score=347.90 TRINITY_DN1758_c0_g1_i16:421-5691(-)